jgi:hypothetical protein
MGGAQLSLQGAWAIAGCSKGNKPAVPVDGLSSFAVLHRARAITITSCLRTGEARARGAHLVLRRARAINGFLKRTSQQKRASSTSWWLELTCLGATSASHHWLLERRERAKWEQAISTSVCSGISFSLHRARAITGCSKGNEPKQGTAHQHQWGLWSLCLIAKSSSHYWLLEREWAETGNKPSAPVRALGSLLRAVCSTAQSLSHHWLLKRERAETGNKPWSSLIADDSLHWTHNLPPPDACIGG